MCSELVCVLWCPSLCVCWLVSGVVLLVYVSESCTRLGTLCVFFSIAMFSDQKWPPFLYDVALENARSKNAAGKSSKSDPVA